MSNEKKQLLHKSCNRTLYCFFITSKQNIHTLDENFQDKIKSYESILESIIFHD